jgi:internalin A
MAFLLCFSLVFITFNAGAAAAAQNTAAMNTTSELHALYPSNAIYSEQIQKYIDKVDSLSFAWCWLDAGDPGADRLEGSAMG